MTPPTNEPARALTDPADAAAADQFQPKGTRFASLPDLLACARKGHTLQSGEVVQLAAIVDRLTAERDALLGDLLTAERRNVAAGKVIARVGRVANVPAYVEEICDILLGFHDDEIAGSIAATRAAIDAARGKLAARAATPTGGADET